MYILAYSRNTPPSYFTDYRALRRSCFLTQHKIMHHNIIGLQLMLDKSE